MDLGWAQQKQSDPWLMCPSMPAASNNVLGQHGPPFATSVCLRTCMLFTGSKTREKRDYFLMSRCSSDILHNKI